jgi:hypothetical protein
MTLSPADARRRWFGLFFLVVSVGILIWGQTVLQEFLALHPRAFVIYWLCCFTFTGLAILVALVDVIIIRKRGRREQRELFRKTFQQAVEENRPEPE